MNKKKLIGMLYVILCLFEDAKNIDKATTFNDYIAYLKRIYITFLGVGIDEISCILKGLKIQGIFVEHEELKSLVFHMIDIVSKEVKE